MTQCEWVASGKDLTEEKFCDRLGTFTVMLKGSNSASNIFFACWYHVKHYRKRKFVEDTFGKGARVEIRHIGRKFSQKLWLRGKEQ